MKFKEPTFKNQVRAFKLQLVESALREHKGDAIRAAAALGIHPQTIRVIQAIAPKRK